MLVPCYGFAILCSLLILRSRELRLVGSAALVASALGLLGLFTRSSPRVFGIGIAAAWLVFVIAIASHGYRLVNQERRRRSA